MNLKLSYVGSRSAPPLTFVPVILKRPEIFVDGNTSFKGTNFDGQLANSYNPLNISGKVRIKFDITDQFNERYSNGIKSQNITYIKPITIDGKIIHEKKEMILPGDISSRAKREAAFVPLNYIFTSPVNILVIVSLAVLAVIGGRLFRKLQLI